MDSSELEGLIQRCLPRLATVGDDGLLESAVVDTSCRVIQKLWAGTGSVLSLKVRFSGGKRRTIIVKDVGPPADPGDSAGKRDHESFYVEASFYEEGQAERLQRAGAACPQCVLMERLEDGRVRICMTRLSGRPSRAIGELKIRAALEWLARLHALYWGDKRADVAVAGGLQPQGCFWHFDARQLEFAKMPCKKWQGRLRRAAAAIDARLKADRLQTIVHGDPKRENIFFDDSGAAQLFDFQWVGKAPATKDVAYCMMCAASDFSPEEEVSCLAHYHAELCSLLRRQGDDPPAFEMLWDSYVLAVCDLGRWMAGWGWWGRVEVLHRHIKEVLERLDGGRPLASKEEYKAAVFHVYPP